MSESKERVVSEWAKQKANEWCNKLGCTAEEHLFSRGRSVIGEQFMDHEGRQIRQDPLNPLVKVPREHANDNYDHVYVTQHRELNMTFVKWFKTFNEEKRRMPT
jgi:hypothetical protein